jgi:sarcosine oxidase, subunit alpha
MSEQPFRLTQGGRIDRSKPIAFAFNGRRLVGYHGDTLASALLANGVALVGRSFKYHRPRGIMTAGSEEPNALVQVGTGARTEPNIRATQLELYEGLAASSQNCWPTVEFDIGEANSVLSKLFPAGFYYKTFMWPPSFWMKYEYFIRRAAGLGVAPTEPDPDLYDKTFAHCDVLVVGGGPAGLAAALAAGRSGARVILCDEQQEFGGSLLSGDDQIDGEPAADWIAGALAQLSAMPEVRLLSRTTAYGYYDHNAVWLVERSGDHLPAGASIYRQRLWKVRAKQVVLATGAIERPLVFADNDRPGIMLADAARTYVNRYGVIPGKRAVVMTNNDSAYRAAIDLARAGAAVAAIVDLRGNVDGALIDESRSHNIEVLAGHGITGTKGRKRVSAVSVARLNDSGDGIIGAVRDFECDLVLHSGGWNPTVHLFSQSGGKVRFDEAIAAFVPDRSIQKERSAGAAKGSFALADCLSQGFDAGRAAASDAGSKPDKHGTAPRAAAALSETPLRPIWVVPSTAPIGHGPKFFVDHQNDATAADVLLAEREGYRSVEHLKRYTTMGMGTDQGKTSNVNALAIIAQKLGRGIPEVGTTTFRPAYTPVTIGIFGGHERGDLMDPLRRTPLHHWHENAGAKWENVGQWRRPWYYPRAGETMHDAVNREVKATRTGVCVMDASTLGRIDIQGPDAVDLLNWVYCNAWSNLEIGRCRYGFMLGEDGMVFDDGVTSRLGEHHFHMTTTSGGAARVLGWLENWLQTEWPEMRVFCTSVTEQWSTIAVNGPFARKLLAELTKDIELEPKQFPFMSFRDGHVAGIPARVYRISFTGELSYEINVAPSYALALWQALMSAGEKYDITPYGTEAMHVLRCEKGFVIVGQETDGTVTPQDLGMDWIVSKKKKDFLGKRALARTDTARADRKHLVGLITENPSEVIPEGGQIVAELKDKPPMAMLGHVTSSYYSPNVGRSIAMALVKNGRKRLGETLYVPLVDRVIKATVTEPRFFDLEGKRIDG